MRQLVSLAFVAAVLLMAGAPLHAAQVAASIEYETIPRPAGLPDDFKAIPRTALQFLGIKTIDGSKFEAAYWTPEGNKPPADTSLIVMVHGSGDNYHNSPNFNLGSGLAAKGYAAIAINTRQHDENVNTDNFLDIARDIQGAVATGRALGYRRIVLQGHSLGNIQVQYYAATNWDPDIKAVILLAPFGNLPWKSRNLLIQNEENFAALTAAATKALKDGKLGDYMPVKMRWFTGQEVPMTAQHFLTYRWEQTSVADGTYWIHRIPHPILVVRDQADGVIQPFEPYQLLSAAHSEGSLVSSVAYVPLPDPGKTPSLEGHSFVGNGERLIEAVSAWLAEQHLLSETRSLEDRLRAVEDRLAIYNVIAAHPASADTGASAFIAASWTADGVFDREIARETGRDAIAAGVLAPTHQAAIAGGIAHFTGLPHVVVDGDTAVVTSYLQIIVPETAGEAVAISGHGSSKGFRLHRVSANRWELVRGPDGWQIKSRTLRPIGTEAARRLLRQGIEPEG